MKHSLINFVLCTLLLVCGGGCSSEDEIDNGGGTAGNLVPLTIRATASSFESLPDAQHPATRTPVEDGLETQFQTGDAIGIFAIKNIGTSSGALVDGLDNSKLTYDATTETWKPEAGKQLYLYEGVSYVAYYPYKEGIAIDATKSVATIIAALAAKPALQPVANQATAAAYTACDLMTASGTPTVDADNPAGQILNLNFTHRFALLVLKPQAIVECITPANAGFTYRTDARALGIDQNTGDVTLNGVTPCRMTDGSYRAIVLPSTTVAPIAGEYKTNDDVTGDAMIMTYSGNSAAFAVGKCYTLEVNHRHSGGSAVRPLAPGDFVFHGTNNIEVYPGDGLLTEDGNTKIPGYNYAVGIVVTCDKSRMTDEECNTAGWSHAYVMGLENAADVNSVWGPGGTDESVLDNIVRDNGVENHMIGYTETELMLAERASKGDLTSYGAFKQLSDYRSSHSVPSALETKRSPWFIPSCGQWFDVMANLCGKSPKDDFRDTTDSYNWIDDNYGVEMWNTINSQLSKVNKPLQKLTSTQTLFWCSSENDDADFAWGAMWDYGGAGHIFYGSIYKGSDVYERVRPFFAF